MRQDRVDVKSKLKARRVTRISLKVKLTVPYLILSLILAIAAGYVITQMMTVDVKERFNKQLFEDGKISSELMVGYETQLLETLRLLTNVEGVSTAIREGQPEPLRSLSLGIIANNQQEAVEFFDTQGNHVLSVHHARGANPEDYTFSSGGQTAWTSLQIVQNALNRVSDDQGDKFADIIHMDNNIYLYVSGPVYDDQNTLAGVILVGRSLETIGADISAKTFAQISFYDLSGRMVFSTLPFSHDLPAGMTANVISFKDTSSSLRELSTQRDIDVANISFTEILGSWEVRGDHQIGVMGIALSKTALSQNFADSRWRIFLLVGTAIFLIMLVGINLANAITRPLVQLVQASKKVAEGDLDTVVNPQSNDEVSLLADSFNSMVSSLNQAQKQLFQSYDDTLEGWAKALELKDKETVGHSKRVTELSVMMAQAMGFEGKAINNIRRGALLHDIGKMGTADAILHKKGPLDDEERQVIQKHPLDGYNLLKSIDFLRSALDIPLYHHEKWDGSGYPFGIKGKEIPVFARIFAIIDVFDALTHDRIYRNAISNEEAIAYLQAQKGSHFDPGLVDKFIHVLQRGK